MALHVMDEANHCLGCKVPRCQQGCPIHTNIPEVIRLLKANKLDEAGRMLFENNPLTTVCSLVCNHENQCEGHCVRGIKGAPVHFSIIENYISSTYASQMTQGPAPSNGKKAAIIGSGPAGLTIAVILARYGYDVTIFESHDKIGGVLRYGIPEFRLPKTVLDDFEYRHLRLKGIKVRPNTDVGKALKLRICSATVTRPSSSAPASGGPTRCTSRARASATCTTPSTICRTPMSTTWQSGHRHRRGQRGHGRGRAPPSATARGISSASRCPVTLRPASTRQAMPSWRA